MFRRPESADLFWGPSVRDNQDIRLNKSHWSRVTRLRRLYFEAFNSSAVKMTHEAQSYSITKMLDKLRTGDNAMDVIARYKPIKNLVSSLTVLCSGLRDMTLLTFYGRLSPQSHRLLTEREDELEKQRTPTIQPFLDLFPFLASLPTWLPGLGFLDDGHSYYKRNHKLWSALQLDVKNQMVIVTASVICALAGH